MSAPQNGDDSVILLLAQCDYVSLVERLCGSHAYRVRGGTRSDVLAKLNAELLYTVNEFACTQNSEIVRLRGSPVPPVSIPARKVGVCAANQAVKTCFDRPSTMSSRRAGPAPSRTGVKSTTGFVIMSIIGTNPLEATDSE